MRKLTRAVVVLACAAVTALAMVPAAEATTLAGSGCRYYYTSWYPGPNGETTGSGWYAEGQYDPEGRVCQDGWWYDNEDDGM